MWYCPSTDNVLRYWLFSAGLIVFSNGFAPVCTDVDTARAMETALNLLQYLGEVDPLARRFHHILVAFHAAISRKEVVAATDPPTATRASNETIFKAFFGGLGGAGIGLTEQTLNAGLASSDHRRNPHLASSIDLHSTNITFANQAAADWQPYFQPPTAQSNSASGVMVAGGEGGTGMMSSGTGISPPDYCLDFDAFVNSVSVGGGNGNGGQSQDIYAQDSWMPLYGTMDLA